MRNKYTSIEEIISKGHGIFTFSEKSDIEVLPNLFSPIFINLKLLISRTKERNYIVKSLANYLQSQNCEYICGIESGGSYYAASVADKLNKPLILMRKQNKDHGDFHIIVGDTPPKKSKVCIIDDVLATGSSLNKAKKVIRSFGCDCQALCVFSYGYDKIIGKKIGIKITSLSNFDNFSEVAKANNQLTDKNISLLKKHLKKYRDFVLLP